MNKEYIKAFWHEFKKGLFIDTLLDIYKNLKLMMPPIILIFMIVGIVWAVITNQTIVMYLFLAAAAITALLVIYSDIKTAKEVADIVAGKKKYCHWYRSTELSEPDGEPFEWVSCNDTHYSNEQGNFCFTCKKEIIYHNGYRPE